MPPLTYPEIASALAPYGVEVPANVGARIGAYIEILLLWNQKISLTSVTEPRQILQRHFGESMFAARAVPISHGRLADVGSGAGFPGLALKLLAPALEVMLIEPNVKKATFLAEVVRKLEFSGVTIERRRFEKVAEGQGFDYVAVRAVGQLPELLRWSAGALAPGGQVVLWLGTELAEAAEHDAHWNWREPLLLPRSKQRFLLVGTPATEQE